MKINFVTTNTLKFEIAREYLAGRAGEFELAQFAIDTPEIQDTSVKEIALQSARWAAEQTGESCVKLDVGFCIEVLDGFPGPFVKYVNDWLTQDDLLRLMHGKANRRAYFEDALAIAHPDGSSKVFTEKSWGSLATKGDSKNTKWPVNSLFIPEGHSKTLSAMSDTEQNVYWRDGLWPQLADYLANQT